MDVYDKLLNMIGYGKITEAGSDADSFPIQTVTYDGKDAKVFILSPYGLHGNLQANTLVSLLAVEGDSANRIGVGGYSKSRPTMAAGENCIYHPPSGAIIHFKAGGGITLTTAGGNYEVESDTNITGNVTITGDATITGDLTVTGTITGGAVKTAAGKDLDLHTHIGSPTAPLGAISPTGIPT